MATPKLDEIQWCSPELARAMGGVHENTVLWYFAESPFYEVPCSNATVLTQAMHNVSISQAIETRKGFERQMSRISGVEFVVASGPTNFGDGQEAPIGEGLFVIRKQDRRKTPGMEDERYDQVTVLGTYFVAGEMVYMAPSVKSVLGSRILTASSALRKFVSTASNLPFYSPATGHRYIKPTTQTSDPPQSTDIQPSRGSTPVPDSMSQTDSVKAAASSTTNAAIETRLLYDSFNRFLQYRGEYMDENPLIGEPGNFVFTSSRPGLQNQQTASHKAQQGGTVQVEAKQQSATPQPAGTPLPVPSAPTGPEMPSEKTSNAPKPKRRKSKAPTGPPTPIETETQG